MAKTQNLSLCRPERILGPEILCGPLVEFDRTDLESVRRAFASATGCALQQAWLAQPEAGFSQAMVRAGWRGSTLMLFAELADTDIFNAATKLNQRSWELGDVFEIFLRATDRESYVEFHVTPHNHRLQLRYPDQAAAARARQADRLEDFLIPGEAFHSRIWIDQPSRHWFVYAEIPTQIVYGSNKSVEETHWHFSFCRYDYTRGVKDPVISSTSPHATPDFHRQHEWGVMTFKNSR